MATRHAFRVAKALTTTFIAMYSLHLVYSLLNRDPSGLPKLLLTIFGLRESPCYNRNELTIEISGRNNMVTDADQMLRRDQSFLTASDCEVIHIAFECRGRKGAREGALLLKSILLHRKNTLRFHLLVDEISQIILAELFRTWKLREVEISFYKLAKMEAENTLEDDWVFQLQTLFPEVVHKVIVLQSNQIVTATLSNLWRTFEDFTESQAIGAVNMTNEVRRGVLLLHLDNLRSPYWRERWRDAGSIIVKASVNESITPQSNMDGLHAERSRLLFNLSCEWTYGIENEPNACPGRNIRVITCSTSQLPQRYYRMCQTTTDFDGNMLRATFESSCRAEAKESTSEDENLLLLSHLVDAYKDKVCEDYAQEHIDMFRTHLHYMDLHYMAPKDGDGEQEVTLVTQASISRIYMVEKLCAVWPGPMSIAIYLRDSDARHFAYYVVNSPVLSIRTNIAFHLVYEEGSQYPTNHLRNVAVRQATTSHVFLLDVDFMPVQDAYFHIKKSLEMMDRVTEKAVLVAPAFESLDYGAAVPKNKDELLGLVDQWIYSQFRVKVYNAGHRATNYSVWANASQAYEIKYEYGYEPYIVMRTRDVPHYNELFMGYGGDKVSHIMNVAAQGYSFVVLPDVFVMHLPHPVSFDSMRFRTSNLMRCMKLLLELVGIDLLKKYGNNSIGGWTPPPLSRYQVTVPASTLMSQTSKPLPSTVTQRPLL